VRIKRLLLPKMIKTREKEKGTSIKIPKSFAKNATYLIHYILVLKIEIQNMIKTRYANMPTSIDT